MRTTILALVAALLVAASPALAGGEKGNAELGVYVGYGWPDDYGIFHPKNGLLYGARLGYFFTRNWSAEASAQRLSTDSEFDILGVPDVDVHMDAVRLNLLYNFTGSERVRPFLTLGAGREKFHPAGYGEACDWGGNAGGGIRFFLTQRLNLRADGRYVMTKVEEVSDDWQANAEASLGIGFLFGGGDEDVAAVEAAPAVNQRPTVSCAGERSEILPGESVSIRATASDPEGDPLTYQWSTTAGRVTGTGSTATFDFTGATPPATATVTVSVSDGHGNSASSNCTVGLREPVRPAEAVSCLAGGFPRNLSRITNVDKACLDDVAQRLTADPRARVIVIGHADSRESSPASVATQRAEAVKNYLVTERGIEASRITARSAAAPGTGTGADAQAGNRRVEVWFVPEGATAPE